METRRRNFMKNLLILVVILVAVYLCAQSPLFRISALEVSGTQLVSEDEVLLLAEVPEDANIFRINLPLLSKSIRLHPLIKNVEIKRKFPSTLRIMITERAVWAVIPYQGSYLYIDEEGVLLDQRLEADLDLLPLLTLSDFPPSIIRGQAVNRTAAELAYQVWLQLKEEHQTKISNYHYDTASRELFLYTIHGAEIRFGDRERMEEKTAELVQMVDLEEELVQSGHDAIEYADIRFRGQPVIKFVE